MAKPLFLAVEPFDPSDGEKWASGQFGIASAVENDKLEFKSLTLILLCKPHAINPFQRHPSRLTGWQ
jgi:hypothetical protein